MLIVLRNTPNSPCIDSSYNQSMEQTSVRQSARYEIWTRPLALVVGLILLGWLLNTPAGLLGKADAVGYAVCHRIDVRSFHLGERQLPLCARCSGMYLGAVLGFIYQAVVSRRRSGAPSKGIILILGMLVLAFAVDGVNSFLSLMLDAPPLYEPQNWTRLLTGTGMGIVIAVAIYPAFNQTAWQDSDRRPAMGSMRTFLGLIVLAFLLDLVVLTENSLVLYPLALISAAGVLGLLTVVYSMVWVMFLRTENSYQRLSQMALPLLGGFGFALLQIVLLDVGRYLLTGTWDGFHIG